MFALLLLTPSLSLPMAQVPPPEKAHAKVPLEGLRQRALTTRGDARRGRELFFNDKLTRCSGCHRIENKGGEVGPDLSQIGGKFDRPHLIESILEPSRQIAEGYRTTSIVTTDGKLWSGIVREETKSRLTLVDVAGKRHRLDTKNIEERAFSRVSLMPDNLADGLTAKELTDLVAYLESLRPRGQPSPGAAGLGPLTFPPGFTVRAVATGVTAATAMEIAPDGRIFVCEQTGTLRVIKQDRLLEQPVLHVPVEANWERGLIGVTVDPDFARRPYVYVCYVAAKPFPHHRISRWTLKGDRAVPGSERILLEGDDQNKLGGQVPAGHQGGALHFGTDGKLYIAIGDQTAGAPAQDLRTLQGKLLRINADGSIPADNPYISKTEGKYRAAWAIGLRNPFTFAVQADSGRILINDVGGNFEEINEGASGANFGWPVVEHGPTSDSRFRGPVHWYPTASIVGGAFAPTTLPWPERYRGHYFFMDFVHGWIKVLDPASPARAEIFAAGLRRPIDLRFAPDGSLYVLVRNAWVMDREFQAGTGSVLKIKYENR